MLDLVGVTLIGLVGALSLATVQGQQPPKTIATLVSAVGLGNLSDVTLLEVIAGAAAVLLLAKTIISPLLMVKVFRFLARRQAIVSARLAKALLSCPLTFVQRRSSQETSAALVQGVSAATVAILGQTVVAVSEIALLTVLAVGLLFVDPAVALGAIVFFAIFAMGLQKILGHRISRVGTQALTADIASLSAVQEALGAYREITVADRRLLYVGRIQGLRAEAARASAGLQVLNLLPKYASEGALVLGGFSLAAVLFSTRPVPLAAGTFALFLATATRIMPSLLRLQSAALSIRSSTGPATLTYALSADLGHPLDTPQEGRDVRESVRRILASGHRDFAPRIELRDIAFSYPGGRGTALQGINMLVAEGQSVAIVGRSGAGKSTLADIILGVLQPDSGELAVGGLNPTDAVRRWPGGIAYVPQDVMLSNDSLRANVALGLPRDDVDDDLVWDALRRARLDEYVRRQPDGLDTQIGERGLRLSGGQRQRLGIARALFTRPRLLVLDEATSALDVETESGITDMLEELEEDVTTVIIAHRLSTVRNVDLVVYLEEGKEQAQGSFDEVCERVPALRRQATLMGLRPA
ncbi:ABC transporter ATP-binding protein [Mycolicibacterium sarraceniae]|uniref:ABC transporter ATP-binding protein n=1 Tax=Mycolicibacterium sarraceniae TaxID=1534348 RepID=A0A7I7ST88_9MYCO|nr:ABC transporter ATP-binding protein [Mycolicibacterium sarraceniae]BBY59369.1 ABC transporter ATP-binding protein [Mycolicibacterium sarraceniae]